MDPLSVQTQKAVAALMQCHATCMAAAAIVQLESTSKGRPQRIRLLLDASAITLSMADALLRKSQFQSQFAQLCIAICETCAQDCERADMNRCGEACRDVMHACAALDVPEKAEILAMASRLPPDSTAM